MADMSMDAVLSGKRNWHVAQGDVLDTLRAMPSGCVNAVVTSPPYYALRSYLPADHPDKAKEHGSEESPEAFIATMVAVFEEVKRVLRDDGVCWVNLGDSYAVSGGSGAPGSSSQRKNRSHQQSNHRTKPEAGLKPGDKLNMPHRVAEALQAAGWWWRDTVVWHKKSPMPESIAGWKWVRCKVKVAIGADSREASKQQTNGRPHSARGDDGSSFDRGTEWTECPGCPKCIPNDGWVLRRGRWRCTQAHEYVFMFAKSAKYFCDGIAAAAGKRDNVKDENKTLQTMRSNDCGETVQQEPQTSGRDAGRMQVVHGREGCKLACDRERPGVNGPHEKGVSVAAGSSGQEEAVSDNGANEGCAKEMEKVSGGSGLRSGIQEIEEQEESVGQIQHKRKGAGHAEEEFSERTWKSEACEVGPQKALVACELHKHADGSGMVGDSGEAEASLFLLQKENDSYDDGSRSADLKGRAPRKGKRRRRVPELQCGEGEQDSDPVLANPRNVLSLAHEPTKEKHFAAYPSELVHFCLKPSIAHAYCAACGAPHAPMVVEERKATRPALTNKIWKHDDGDKVGQRSDDSPNLDPERHIKCSTVVGYRATCGCNAGTTTGLVLDPYCGTGTTGEVALKLGARFLGCELNPEYKVIADNRVHNRVPLFV